MEKFFICLSGRLCSTQLGRQIRSPPHLCFVLPSNVAFDFVLEAQNGAVVYLRVFLADYWSLYRNYFPLTCREVLDLAGKAVKVGATTDDVDRACHEAAVERGAYPSPLNYFGFPKRYVRTVYVCRARASSVFLVRSDKKENGAKSRCY